MVSSSLVSRRLNTISIFRPLEGTPMNISISKTPVILKMLTLSFCCFEALSFILFSFRQTLFNSEESRKKIPLLKLL